MGEISNSKTWTKIYNSIASGTNSLKEFTRKFKDSLITAGWTHISSSNAVTTSSSDLWLLDSDIVHAIAPSAHSWIVLGNNNICSGYQICIDLNSNVAYQIRVYTATSGFTGGTTTDRPTAINEIETTNGATSWINSTTSYSKQYNLFYSSDGQSFRSYMSHSSTTFTGFFFIDKIQSAQNWLTIPAIIHIGSSALSRSNLTTTGALNFDGKKISTTSIGIVAGSTYVADLAILNSGDYNSTWPSDNVLIGSRTMTVTGIFGYIADLWHAIDDLADFDYFPGDGSKQQVVISDFIQGSDGSTVSL